MLGDSEGNATSYNVLSTPNTKTADIVINGALVELKLFIYGKVGYILFKALTGSNMRNDHRVMHTDIHLYSYTFWLSFFVFVSIPEHCLCTILSFRVYC